MAATSHEPERQPLHILFLPYFAPGHLIPVADMAALFAARGARCTILTTPVNADIIRPSIDRANDSNLGSPAIDISLMPFPDVGLPPGVENAMALATFQVDYRARFIQAVELVREPFDRFLADHRPDAVVSDSFFSWSVDAAAAHGVPRIVFTGTSVFARSCNESMLRNNPLETMTAASPDDDDDEMVLLPGLPHRVELRRSQMMDPRKQPRPWEFFQSNNAADQRSFGEVFNSFHDLEPDYVVHLHTALGRRAWLVGPLALGTNANALPLGDGADSCLRWLDTKPAVSVLYVSFGTVTRFSPAELREIARGLDLSGRNFVWVISADAGTDDWSQWMPERFAALTAHIEDSRGFVIRGWAPQPLILNHPSLGGFMTHCGWNSVLEAVSAGVPMVTWPRYADQFYNEKLAVEVLRVGVSVGARDYASSVDTHEVIGGEVIAGSIVRLMGDDAENDHGVRKKAKELGALARGAVEKGGSSYDDVGRLMDELMARRSSGKAGEEDIRAAGGA